MRTRGQNSAGPMNMQPDHQLAISPSLPMMPTMGGTSPVPTNRKRRNKKDDVQTEIAKKVIRRRSLKKQRQAQNRGPIQVRPRPRGSGFDFLRTWSRSSLLTSAFALERTRIPTVQSATQHFSGFRGTGAHQITADQRTSVSKRSSLDVTATQIFADLPSELW